MPKKSVFIAGGAGYVSATTFTGRISCYCNRFDDLGPRTFAFFKSPK